MFLEFFILLYLYTQFINTYIHTPIQELLIKKELSKDPTLKEQNWDRFIPKYTKTNIKKKRVVVKPKKEYTPFPPPQMPRKIDLEMETGEYWSKNLKSTPKLMESTKDRETNENIDTANTTNQSKDTKILTNREKIRQAMFDVNDIGR